MEMNWLQSLIVGLVSGFAEIIPVSAEAHRLLILKFFGFREDGALVRLMVHVGTVAALYYCSRKHIVMMMRAYRLSRIPKKRRKRPLDMKSMNDFNLLRTALIPCVLALILYSQIRAISGRLLWVGLLLFVNGVILYIPQYLPGANKDSGAMNRLEGLILGLGGGLSVLPGLSCTGNALSVASVLGMEPKHGLNIAIVMNIPMVLGYAVWDMIDIVNLGLNGFSFLGFAGALLAGCAAFAGVFLGVKVLRKLHNTLGVSVFAFYCWGAALLMFIFYLTAA